MWQSLKLCSYCFGGFYMPVCWEPSYCIHIQSKYLYILQYYYCCNFLLTENDYSTVYPMTVNLHKGPSPTVRKAKLCLWRKYILRAEGGISCALPWKCSPLTQIRREQKNAWSSSTCLLYGISHPKIRAIIVRRTVKQRCKWYEINNCSLDSLT